MILLPGGNGDFSRIIPGVSVRAQRMAVQLTALRSVSSGVETSSADNESGGHNARIYPPGEDYTGGLAQDQCTAQDTADFLRRPQPTCGPSVLRDRDYSKLCTFLLLTSTREKESDLPDQDEIIMLITTSWKLNHGSA